MEFQVKAAAVLEYQMANINVLYEFASLTGKLPAPEAACRDLPFLPVEFFRERRVLPESKQAKTVFRSSGTTDMQRSRHFVADTGLYLESIFKGFEQCFGDRREYEVFALLPSYLEQDDSSLVFMTEHLIRSCGDAKSEEAVRRHFYKNDTDRLMKDLQRPSEGRKKLLIGVSFALWELAENYSGTDLSDVIIIETGGMKGRRREIIRSELHDIICSAFNKTSIYSEYGMTEMLSQAWSMGNGVYECPPWVKVLVRDPYDPLQVNETGKGAINIVDLANLYSCSFLATGDLGEVYDDGRFTVSGRLDHSALRGCNLLS